ncbi:MAG: hypothetical protein ABSB19_04085 [Methylomonas sp.]|jgi:hypothetical protein
MDRGFPATWLFTLLQQRKIPFLARMDCSQWKFVKNFQRSGLNESVVTIPVSQAAHRQAQAVGQTLIDKNCRYV